MMLLELQEQNSLQYEQKKSKKRIKIQSQFITETH